MIDWLKEPENTEHRRAAEQGHRPYDTAWLRSELKIEAPRRREQPEAGNRPRRCASPWCSNQRIVQVAASVSHASGQHWRRICPGVVADAPRPSSEAVPGRMDRPAHGHHLQPAAEPGALALAGSRARLRRMREFREKLRGDTSPAATREAVEGLRGIVWETLDKPQRGSEALTIATETNGGYRDFSIVSTSNFMRGRVANQGGRPRLLRVFAALGLGTLLGCAPPPSVVTEIPSVPEPATADEAPVLHTEAPEPVIDETAAPPERPDASTAPPPDDASVGSSAPEVPTSIPAAPVLAAPSVPAQEQPEVVDAELTMVEPAETVNARQKDQCNDLSILGERDREVLREARIWSLVELSKNRCGDQ